MKNVCIGDKNKRILFDNGFEGLDKDCPSMANLIKPTKRKRGQKFLSKTVLNKNRRISKKRVKIENAFAGVKRLKITWDIFRNIKEGFSDKVFWIACGRNFQSSSLRKIVLSCSFPG